MTQMSFLDGCISWIACLCNRNVETGNEQSVDSCDPVKVESLTHGRRAAKTRAHLAICSE